MVEVLMETQEIMGRLDVLEDALKQLRELLTPVAVPREVGKETEHPYIEQVPDILSGEPIIKGTRTPVRAIVEHWKFGDSPEEIARQLPHLRLAQIFDALSYYDDHREEIERYIALNRVPVNG
jgi:uncharacterized protein (DUF433 family)